MAIEPDGSLYSCGLKTQTPLGKPTEERLTDILDDLRAVPAVMALDRGDPEGMGEQIGLARATFRAGRSDRADGRHSMSWLRRLFPRDFGRCAAAAP